MNSQPNIITTLIIAILASLLLVGAAAASTITLRASVRLPADTEHVRLADIAVLEGEDAEAHADVVVARITDPAEALEIPLRQVRERLDEAGVHWGRTNLNGRVVIVRPLRRGDVTPPLPMTSASIEGTDESRSRRQSAEHESASAIVKERTLRGSIARFIARGLDVDASELQLRFDPRDREALEASVEEYRFEIEPASSLRSNRIDLNVRAWKDNRVRHRWTVRAEALIYRPMVVVQHDVPRGHQLVEEDLRVERAWMEPHQPGLLYRVDEAVGRLVSTTMREGDRLREPQLRQQTLIRRGAIVTVRCVVGGTVISMQAEAREDGAEGKTIELRKIGERDTFRAIVTARNEAVVDLSRHR